MILIYSHIITPRIKYIFKHIFKLRLGVDVNFTSDINDFKKYEFYLDQNLASINAYIFELSSIITKINYNGNCTYQ